MAIVIEDGKVIVSAQVPIAMRTELERLADGADRSLSAEVRRALTEHVSRCRPAGLEHAEAP